MSEQERDNVMDIAQVLGIILRTSPYSRRETLAGALLAVDTYKKHGAHSFDQSTQHQAPTQIQ